MLSKSFFNNVFLFHNLSPSLFKFYNSKWFIKKFCTAMRKVCDICFTLTKVGVYVLWACYSILLFGLFMAHCVWEHMGEPPHHY